LGKELQPLGSVPPARRIQGRHISFDALAAACGNIDTRNRSLTAQLSRALKDIRGYFWEETDGLPTGVTMDEWELSLARAIHARAKLYRNRFPGAEITPTALAKWWHQLLRPATARPRGMTASEFAQAEIPRPLQKLEALMKEESNRGT